MMRYLCALALMVALSLAVCGEGVRLKRKPVGPKHIAELNSEDVEEPSLAQEEVEVVVNATAGGVPQLAAQTRSDLWMTRYNALKALRDLGSLAREALPAITLCLADPDKACRDMARLCLDGLGGEHADKSAKSAMADEIKDSVGALCGNLDSGTWMARSNTLLALYYAGPIVGDICLGNVTLRLMDPGEMCRDQTKKVLWKLGKADHGAIRSMARQWLGRRNSYTLRMTAIKGLEWLSWHVDGGGSWAKPAMDEIIDAMGDPDTGIGARAKRAVDNIRQADERPSAKRCCCKAPVRLEFECRLMYETDLKQSRNPLKWGEFVCPSDDGYQHYERLGYSALPESCYEELSVEQL